MGPERLEELMQTFATLSAAERHDRRFAKCPPHICKKWQLGVARRKRKEECKLSSERVTQSMPSVKFVFDAEPGWVNFIVG